MQSQQRAENGVKEIVLGYYGHDTEELPAKQTVTEVVGGFDAGPVKQMNLDDLPEEVRSIFLAEQHRLETGEFIPSNVFRRSN